eukprot:2061688-Pyramimonas_sp.AAC.1
MAQVARELGDVASVSASDDPGVARILGLGLSPFQRKRAGDQHAPGACCNELHAKRHGVSPFHASQVQTAFAQCAQTR